MTPGYRGRPWDTECVFFFVSNPDVAFDRFWLHHVPRAGDMVGIGDSVYKIVEVEWPLDIPTKDYVYIMIDHINPAVPLPIMAPSQQAVGLLQGTINHWKYIVNERPSDNMIYHCPTIAAMLKDLQAVADKIQETKQ